MSDWLHNNIIVPFSNIIGLKPPGPTTEPVSVGFVFLIILLAATLVTGLQVVVTAMVRGSSKRELTSIVSPNPEQLSVLPDYLRVALTSVDSRTNSLYSQAVYFLDRSFATMRYLIYFGCLLIVLALIIYLVLEKRDEAILAAGSGVLMNLISVFQNFVSRAGSRFERFQNVLIDQNNLILAICMASQLHDERQKNDLIAQAVQSLIKGTVHSNTKTS